MTKSPVKERLPGGSSCYARHVEVHMHYYDASLGSGPTSLLEKITVITLEEKHLTAPVQHSTVWWWCALGGVGQLYLTFSNRFDRHILYYCGG
eukprot:1194712-Prorocentrum_minimum.AAC.9